jgi:hypothetical protein
MNHDHEFHGEPDEVLIEDDAVIEQKQCNHRPINGSQTSERLDETFYDEGPRCEVVQWRRHDMDIEPEPGNWETWEAVVLGNEDAIIEAATVGDDRCMVETEHNTWTITFDRTTHLDY